jgi:hypothetical protein
MLAASLLLDLVTPQKARTKPRTLEEKIAAALGWPVTETRDSVYPLLLNLSPYL